MVRGGARARPPSATGGCRVRSAASGHHPTPRPTSEGSDDVVHSAERVNQHRLSLSLFAFLAADLTLSP